MKLFVCILCNQSDRFENEYSRRITIDFSYRIVKRLLPRTPKNIRDYPNVNDTQLFAVYVSLLCCYISAKLKCTGVIVVLFSEFLHIL